METAGNDQFDDDTEKKGLGTPATRAGIIEKLVKSGFAERKGKSLIPTKDGCNLVCVLPEQITSPAMTAEWENTLMEIERGKADADAFLSGIVRMTGDLVKAYDYHNGDTRKYGNSNLFRRLDKDNITSQSTVSIVIGTGNICRDKMVCERLAGNKGILLKNY